jgi:hypothetical protein
MVMCEWQQDIQAGSGAFDRETQMDWKVFYQKEQALKFVKETFEDFEFYDTEVRAGLQLIQESFEPQSFHDGYRNLDLPSWIIGSYETGWSATISIEELEY